GTQRSRRSLPCRGTRRGFYSTTMTPFMVSQSAAATEPAQPRVQKKGGDLSTAACLARDAESRTIDYRLSILDSRRSTDLFAEIPRPRRERFFRLDEVLHIPLEIELLIARLRRRRRWRRLVRRDPDVSVVLESGPGRNQPAHRHVLLQAAQM